MSSFVFFCRLTANGQSAGSNTVSIAVSHAASHRHRQPRGIVKRFSGMKPSADGLSLIIYGNMTMIDIAAVSLDDW